jgi:hypothetical protein
MALDNTQPKVGAIAQVAILAIVSLLFTRAGLLAYFDRMARAEEYRKWGSLDPAALHSVRADEKQRLSSGAMPIDKAMQLMATKGRMGASQDIVPAASAKDIAPLQGWTRMPAEVPPAMSVAPAPPPPAPEVVAGDAGAAAPATTPDAGPPEPKHP